MKLLLDQLDPPGNHVAPLVGAWIEIFDISKVMTDAVVAPLVGAWIEIWRQRMYNVYEVVAPLVGAWIEILYLTIATQLG